MSRPALAFTAAILIGVAGLPLAGCKDRSGQGISVDVIGAADDPFEGGSRLSTAGQIVREATSLGLVGVDAQGRVVPALADRWIVTDDGLSYIFRLTDGTWSDGTSLSSDSARDALRVAISSLQTTGLGADLDAIAEIRAMTGRVIEVRLTHPMPDLLDLLAQPELALRKSGKGTGPFRLFRDKNLAELVPVAQARRNDQPVAGYRDGMKTVNLRAVRAAIAVAQFDQGATDVVTGGSFTDYPLALTVAGLSRRALKLDPVSGLLGLAFDHQTGLLADPASREAIAMAIDRDALASRLSVQGWTPLGRIIPADAADAPVAVSDRWVGMDITQRKAEARKRIATSTGRGRTPPVLTIALPTGPGADALFERLAIDLGDIGLRAARANPDEAADLRLVDTVARYARADWFLAQFSCALARKSCSATADHFAAQAREETDPAKRAELLADAETALTKANVFIPLGPPIRWSLVRDPQPGFAPNTRALHPLSELAMRPR